jgi:hypothetical protein
LNEAQTDQQDALARYNELKLSVQKIAQEADKESTTFIEEVRAQSQVYAEQIQKRNQALV